MRAEIQRKKQLRAVVGAVYCVVQLAVALLGFHGLRLLLTPAAVTEEASVHHTFDVWTGASGDAGEPVVCIDAGHGGKDNGSNSGQRMEKDDNLRIAQAVADYLRTQGASVVMTRTDDVFLELSERCEIANGQGADYFVSLHRNDGDGKGVEVWVYSGAGEETGAMAERILTGLDAAGIQENRGVRRGTQGSDSENYYINAHVGMPSCIVELGFIGNAHDNQLFDEKLEEYAAAIGDAILETYDIYRDIEES